MKANAHHILLFITLILVLASSPATADIPPVGGPSLMFGHDKLSGANGLAYEANVAVAFINGSLSLRHWDREVTGWNGHVLNNEVTAYVGLGFFNLIEVQRGYSNAGSRTRIRADIVLSDQFPFASSETWGQFKKGIVLTPFVELGSGKKVYGLGVGLQFD